MDEQRIKQLLQEKHFGRCALYFELFYVLLLLITLIWNFSLFAHLIVGQFFIILAYFLIGWIYVAYLKVNRKNVKEKNKKQSLMDKLAEAFPHHARGKTFYHVLDTATAIVSAGLVVQTFALIFQDLGLKNNDFAVFDSLALYANVVCLFALFGITIGILMGYKRMVRNASLIVMILSIVLAICWPQGWITYAIELVVGALAFWVYLKNQI